MTDDIPEIDAGDWENAESRFAALFYEAMFSQSVLVDGETVFIGKVTAAYRSVGAPVSYYSRVRALLLSQRCIQYLARGSHAGGTVVRLDHAPEKIYADRLTPVEPRARMRLQDTERRVARLEARLAGLNLREMVINYETRISRLEREIEKLKNNNSSMERGREV